MSLIILSSRDGITAGCARRRAEEVLAVVAALCVATVPYEVGGAVFGERMWMWEQKRER
jgi:hypothetical protein